MTKAEMIAQLRRVANELESAPDFVEPISAYFSVARLPHVLLRWDEFNRLFLTAESTIERGVQHLSTVVNGIDWTANRTLPDVQTTAVALPIAEAACEEGGRYA